VLKVVVVQFFTVTLIGEVTFCRSTVYIL